MEAPIMDGNKKKIKMVMPFINPFIAIGELIILEEPVVVVKESKKPAALAEIKIASAKKMPK
jgi:hypothetical protein